VNDLLECLKATLGDRYHIERELGRGGMATVYLANDLRHHRRVALKVLRPEVATAVGTERFLREIEMCAQLTHPHIVPLHDSGEASGFLYYVMPYVEGESLRCRLAREKQLPLDDALQIAREVADALEYAHSHGVVHRDIKPENILLESGHAVVVDFGIARAVSEAGVAKLTGAGMTLGTPHYMSPEQARESGELDGRSDIYSLGCVLYEMLAGEPPFTGPTVASVVQQHFSAEPPKLTAMRPTAPTWLVSALERALAKTAADRFPRAALFAEALSPKVPVTEGPFRTAATRKLTVGVLSAAAVIAVVGLARFLPRRSGARLDRERVLVVPFTGESGSKDLQELGRMTQDYVIQVLTEAGFAKVVDPLTALAVSQNVAAASVAGGPGGLAALAYDAGAGTVVSGTCYAEGDSLHIQVRISDARDGSLLGTVGPLVGSRLARRELVARVGREVVAALAARLNRELGAFEPTAQPATYEAYEAYTQGLNAYLDNAYDVAARDFEQAVTADPTFARARLWAAQATVVSAALMGDAVTYEKAESLLAPLAESRSQLSRFDRCRYDFVTAMLQGGLASQYDGARCMSETAPGSDDAKRELAMFTLRLNRPQEAIRLLEELDPDHGLMKRWWQYWVELGAAYHMLGAHERELEVARQGQRRFPTNVAMLAEEAGALAALGRVDDVAVTLEAMRSLGSPETLGSRLGAIGQELRAHGHPDAAREAFDEAIAWYRTRPEDTEPARAELAGVLYSAERWDDALRLYAELAEQHPGNIWYAAALGKLAARHGDSAAALSTAERLRAVRVPTMVRWATDERARIAVLLGQRDEAVTLLRQAIDEGIWDNLYYLHADIDFESLHDYPPFQELLKPKG
jgi:tRNA A-37 threonylcarbamoyl transferase component Bud32/tetratricopeptide (TPR) repeat protein